MKFFPLFLPPVKAWVYIRKCTGNTRIDDGFAKQKIHSLVDCANHFQAKGESLLSQCKALQLHCWSFCRWDGFWELNFNFWLIFTHHSCEHITDAKLASAFALHVLKSSWDNLELFYPWSLGAQLICSFQAGPSSNSHPPFPSSPIYCQRKIGFATLNHLPKITSHHGSLPFHFYVFSLWKGKC